MCSQYLPFSDSQERLITLAVKYGVNAKNIIKWKNRTTATGAPTDPKEVRSTVSSVKEATIIAFRTHMPLLLGDRIYALQ